MKVAISGASGFVGRHVLRKVLGRPDISVTTLTRRPVDRLDEYGSFKQVLFDFTNPTGPELFRALGEPDVLIHLAWSNLPNYGSMKHFEDHLGEQFRLLKSLVESGLRSVTCVGTCFEYGMQSGQLHELLPTDPCTPYGFAKDALRRELQFLQNFCSFDLNWARLFYVYGNGQAASSLYSQLLAAGQRGDKIFKMSPGDQLRDFLPIDTAAHKLVSLALDAPGSGVVNVCSGVPVSVRSLVERVISENNFAIELALGTYSYPTYEPMAFWGNSERLNTIIAGK